MSYRGPAVPLWMALICASISHSHAGLDGVFGWEDMVIMNHMNTGPTAAATIGTSVPLRYFGPAPSEINPLLMGPLQLLRSGIIDVSTPSIKLPLYRGKVKDEQFWYIVTDTSDETMAAALGLNPSSKLQFAEIMDNAVRTGRLDTDLHLVTDFGNVDFRPQHSITPGTGNNAFPPSAYQPGSVGYDNYTPLVKMGNGVYNMPIVAGNVDEQFLAKWCNGTTDEAFDYVHDRVLAICPDVEGASGGTVTMQLVNGFSFGRPILYVTTDANDMMAATVEKVNFAPGLKHIAVGGDDTMFSAVERKFSVVNGHTNNAVNTAQVANGPGETVHPGRQGLNSVLQGDYGGPLNVLGGIPTVATDYSPLWDLHLGEWTEYAVANGYRIRLEGEFQYLDYVQRGFITGPGGKQFGSTGIIVNCPVAQRFL